MLEALAVQATAAAFFSDFLAYLHPCADCLVRWGVTSQHASVSLLLGTMAVGQQVLAWRFSTSAILAIAKPSKAKKRRNRINGINVNDHSD